MAERVILSDRLLAGDPRALARLVTLVENGDPTGEASLTKLYPHTGRAHIVGITGPPGAGKSTIVNALIGYWRGHDQRVAVVAVDPTSPLTGGAVLGDRIRMMRHHADPGVFIRGMASRGRGGGLALTTSSVIHLFDAAGYEIIVVETVGVGQDEVLIATRAHTTVLVQVPGLGDSVQTIKAGILEIGDIVVVNKADQPDADQLLRDLRQLFGVHHTPTSGDSWSVPLLKVIASQDEGIAALGDAIAAHRAHLHASGEWAERQRTIAAAEISDRLRAGIEHHVNAPQATALQELIDDVTRRRRSPGEAVEMVLADAMSTSGASPSTRSPGA